MEWEDLNGIVGGGVEKEDAAERQGDKVEGDETRAVREARSTNWTDGMVDVELKEAMEEIEGFELPGSTNVEVTKNGDETMAEENQQAETTAAKAVTPTPEIDEVT